MNTNTKVWLAASSTLLLVVVLARADDWPGFRGGPRRDAVSRETGLLKSWPKSGPRQLWKTDGLGIGCATLAVADGKVFVAGAMEGQPTKLSALECSSGRIEWQSGVGGGYSRGTPTVSQGKIYMQLGGRIYCHDATDGRRLWDVDLMSLIPDAGDWKDRTRYGTWSQSPLVALNKVFLVAGHPKACVVALDQDSGELVWTSEGSREASSRGWSSPIMVRHGGRDLLIAQTAWHVLGLDPGTGQVHWEQRIFGDGRDYQAGMSLGNIPVFVDGRFFCATGYGPVIWSTFDLSSSGKKITKAWNSDAIRPFQESVVCVGSMLFGHGKLSWVHVDKNPNLLFDGRPFAEQRDQFRPPPDERSEDPWHRSNAIRYEESQPGESPYLFRSGGLICQDFQTGRVLGTRYGFRGPGFSGLMLAYADGMLYAAWSDVFDKVYLIEASPEMSIRGVLSVPVPEVEKKPEISISNGCFCAPVISNGTLYLRAHGRVLAYDVRGKVKQ